MTATAQPETGPANSLTDADTGSRVYIHPITQEVFVSVTTVLDLVAKQNLHYWAAKVAQEYAMDRVPLLVQAQRRRPCEMKGSDRCGACRDCVALDIRRAPDRERDEAGDRGSRLHAVAEHYVLHGEIRPHDDDIAPYVQQWQRWTQVHKVQFLASEVTVINRDLGYAGTLDVVARNGWMPPKWKHLTGVPMIGDFKTGKSAYVDHAWQLAAYRHAKAVLLPDGTELPMPEVHPEIGLGIQIRPEDFYVRPLRVCDRAFRAFRNVLEIYRDLHDDSFDLIGRAMYKPQPATTEK